MCYLSLILSASNPHHSRLKRQLSLPSDGSGSPATRDGALMILNSRLLSLFTRCIAAFVSAPLRATTGALHAGAAGSASAGTGAVKAPIVGGMKTSAPPNE